MMNQIIPNHCQNVSTHSSLDFWPIWLKYERQLLNKCRQLMNGDLMKAEDALSEVRKKAWKAWPKIATDLKNPRAWLLTIASNHCRDIHRAAKRHAIAIDEVDTYNVESITSTSPAKTPFQKLLKTELYQVLQIEIQELPKHLREPFVDYYLREKTTQEISQRLEISEATVYKRNQKARERLRHHLNLYLHSDRYQRKINSETIPTVTSSSNRVSTPSTHTYRISVSCQTMQPQLWSHFSILLGCK